MIGIHSKSDRKPPVWKTSRLCNGIDRNTAVRFDEDW